MVKHERVNLTGFAFYEGGGVHVQWRRRRARKPRASLMSHGCQHGPGMITSKMMMMMTKMRKKRRQTTDSLRVAPHVIFTTKKPSSLLHSWLQTSTRGRQHKPPTTEKKLSSSFIFERSVTFKSDHTGLRNLARKNHLESTYLILHNAEYPQYARHKHV